MKINDRHSEDTPRTRVLARLRPRPRPVRVETVTEAARESIWRIIADPVSYQVWVAGTAVSDTGHGSWPRAGATLEHTWGPRPFRVHDHTTVTLDEPAHRLNMHALVRPLARVDISITLADTPGGTSVSLCETVVAGLAAWLPFLTVPIQRARNRRSLRRLVALAS